MSEQNQNAPTDGQISDDQLKDVVGGNKIQKKRLDALDTRDSSKSVDDIQATRLDQLDANDSSK